MAKRTRAIIIGDPIGNQSQNFLPNTLRTARFRNSLSLLTYGFLWLIVKSLSSIYFLTVGLFQLLTPFSPTGKFSTIGPYLSNKAIELYLLFTDDQKRKNSDMLINKRTIRVITKEGLITKSRQDLNVGDIILLEAEWRQEEVPADVLLLSSPTGDVFVNMSTLTGEKDPVQRRVPERLELDLSTYSNSDYPLVYGCLYCNEPAAELDNFSGELCIGTDRYICTADNIVLAGSVVLQGTDIFGVVFATQQETKLHIKSHSSASASSLKLGFLDREINFITAWTLFFLICFILCGTVGYQYFHYRTMDYDNQSEVYPEQTSSSLHLYQIMLLYFLLFNSLIAQTLHFSLECVRRMQSWLVNFNNFSSAIHYLLGYNKGKNFESKVEVHNLAALENLALCQCIVFDKTGTLTANQLIPKYFSTFDGQNNHTYSIPSEKSISNHNIHKFSPRSLQIDSEIKKSQNIIDISNNNNSNSNNIIVNGTDDSSENDLINGDFNDLGKHPNVKKDLHRLLLTICLNNSVSRISEKKRTISSKGKIASIESPKYFGTSADEVALLESVYKLNQYYLIARDSKSSSSYIQKILLHTNVKEDGEWELIHLFKYSSAKGKMTVIVRNTITQSVYLITKGSPEKLYPYLKFQNHRKAAEESVNYMAKQGLRVLLYAMKTIEWTHELTQHLSDLKNDGDDLLLDSFCDDLESSGLSYVGITGTEDKLHPNLSKSIHLLQDAEIKTIVCTGDIKLTARNIGQTAGILPTNDSLVFEISVSSSLENQLESIYHLIKQASGIESSSNISLDQRENQYINNDNNNNNNNNEQDRNQEVIELLRGKHGKIGLVIGNNEIPEILENETSRGYLIKIIRSEMTKGVVIYRAGPAMKAMVTRFLKDNHLITCCVGDGANDIEMICEADIGIGIMTGENQHAAASSDIAIDCVTSLPDYILYHGAQFWERNVRLTHFISSMKLTVVFSLLFYDISNYFVAESLFTGRMLLSFNCLYGWSVIVYCLCYMQYSRDHVMKNPSLFKDRPKLDDASFLKFGIWWMKSFFDAVFALLCGMFFFN